MNILIMGKKQEEKCFLKVEKWFPKLESEAKSSQK